MQKKKKNLRVFAPLGRKVINSQIQNVTSSITSIISYMLTITECGFNEQSKHRYHIIVLLHNSLSSVVCHLRKIWDILPGLPSEALGHSEWETQSGSNDLFSTEQWERAESWEAKGFNRINVPFVISLSALSVCMSVYPFVVCWLSVYIYSAWSICLSAGCLSAHLSFCLICFACETRTVKAAPFLRYLKMFFVSLLWNESANIQHCAKVLRILNG